MNVGSEEFHIVYKRSPVEEINPALYSPKDEEKVFFKKLTKLEDDEKLREHILRVQRAAFEVFPYPCIHGFRFLTMKISRLPAYPDVLALGKNRKGAILLDVGTCFGNDPRKAVLDGYPVDQILATDITPEFWELGHKLFKDDPKSFPVPFFLGDIFEDAILKVQPTSGSDPADPASNPRLLDLRTFKTLNQLAGKVSAIHVSSFFHLFNAEKQLTLARKLATLLSPEPGSIIFGSHVGSTRKGWHADILNRANVNVFCHSPESFKELWEKEVFGCEEGSGGGVVCEAFTTEYQSLIDMRLLVWSVRRV